MYYMNLEVEVLGKLAGNRVAIAVLQGASCQDETGYSEPFYSEIIVPESELTDKKFVFSDEFKQHEQKLKDSAIQIKKEARDKLEELKKEEGIILKRLGNYKGVMEALKFLDPEYKFVVVENWNGLEVLNMEDGRVADADYHKKYRALAVITKDRKTFTSEISEYSDGGGTYKDCKYFKTMEEAKSYLIESVEFSISDGNGRNFTKTIERHNLSSPLIIEYLEKVKAREILEIKKEIERREKDVRVGKEKLEALA